MIKSLFTKMKDIYSKLDKKNKATQDQKEKIESLIEEEVSRRVEERLQELKAKQQWEQERQDTLAQERQALLEKERLEQLERERQEQLENERLERLERERQKQLEKEKIEQLEREKLVQLQEERKKQLEKKKLELLERVRQEQLENERLERLERERREQLRKERLERLERKRKEQLEKERLALLERERKAQLERERLEQLKRERQRQLEKEKLEQLERERQRQLENERLEQLERERQKQLERERIEQLKRERQKQLEREKQERIEKERQEQEKKLKERASFYHLNIVDDITPLMKAASNNDVLQVKQLIESRANPNDCNQYLETALVYALKSIKRGSFSEVVEILLKNGVNPHVQTTLGPTAYTYAKSRKDTKSMELLEAYEADHDPYTPTITNKKQKKRNEKTSKMSPPKQNLVQPSIEIKRPQSTENQTQPIHIDRSHASEKSFYEHIRAVIKENINKLREVMRRNDLGGADQFTNAVLRGRKQKQIYQLEELYMKPYFGRVIYKTSNNQTRSIRIGDYSFGDEIISWTTPAASLFYQKKLGPVTHRTLGKVKVELIRQIHGGEIYDLEVTKSGYYDPILHKKLGAQSNHKLGDIVETIQAEQDEILRKPKNQYIIVQGSAGSGKTTIALHRIPYLLQTHKEIKPDHILFLGPNKLFLNYIDEVLPGIGVDHIEQNTFEGWVTARINPKHSGFTVTDYNENINIIEKLSESKRELVIEKCKLKGSLTFKNRLEQYIRDYTTEFPAVPDFAVTFEDIQLVIPSEQIKEWFNYDYQSTPFYDRKKKILSRLDAELKSFIIKEKKKRDLKEETIDSLNKAFKQELATFNANYMRYINIYEIYYRFLTNRQQLQIYMPNAFKSEASLDYFVNHSTRMKQDEEIEYDDLSALLLIYQMLYGAYGVPEHKHHGKKSRETFSRNPYQYVVIDEAQDYNPFQIAMLKQATAKGSIMLVGDLGQSIHEYRGISSWSEFRDLLKDENGQGVLYQELSTSYRSTNDITQLANEIIRPYSLGNDGRVKFNLSQPVGRIGKAPSIMTSHANEMSKVAVNIVNDVLSRNIFNIGIITKTRMEATLLYQKLVPHIDDLTLFDTANNAYEGGVVILPSYLSKGLEFDAVIVYNVSKENYQEDDNDMKLLYVAATRALNELYIVAESHNVSKLVDGYLVAKINN